MPAPMPPPSRKARWLGRLSGVAGDAAGDAGARSALSLRGRVHSRPGITRRGGRQPLAQSRTSELLLARSTLPCRGGAATADKRCSGKRQDREDRHTRSASSPTSLLNYPYFVAANGFVPAILTERGALQALGFRTLPSAHRSPAARRPAFPPKVPLSSARGAGAARSINASTASFTGSVATAP